METKSVRYNVEHKALRDAFFLEGPNFNRDLLCSPGLTVTTLYNKLGKEEQPDYECPYSPESFSGNQAVYTRSVDSVLIYRITMPEPETLTNCRAVYLCYSAFGGFKFYMTSELSENNIYFLCGCDEDGRKFNFGGAPSDPKSETDLVAYMFWFIKDKGDEVLRAAAKQYS